MNAVALDLAALLERGEEYTVKQALLVELLVGAVVTYNPRVEGLKTGVIVDLYPQSGEWLAGNWPHVLGFDQIISVVKLEEKQQ